MNQKIPVYSWAQRLYPGEVVGPKVDRAWVRLKARLRDHGVSLNVPNFAGATGQDFETKHGDLTWMQIPSTPANLEAVYGLMRRLDDNLLSKDDR